MGANASHHEPLGAGEIRPNVPPGLFSPYGRSMSIRKSLKRRKEKRRRKQNQHQDPNRDGGAGPQIEAVNEAHERKMDKLRRSFRDSFKKPKKDQHVPESSKPHTWLIDESSVRAGTCSFPVKYLGCVEVFESRGMQVCEEALKVLRNSRRRPLRGMLYVSGDGLRVVDDDTKGLLVDQTIEKVSFCAPDRNHERGFSYICRDGTTRRWMCHGFIAVKETGERLSHAVGCAFAACLERKQKRDKECGVTMTFDQTTSTFTRMGSFRQMSLTERLSDPQECKPIETQVPVKKVDNPHAIARPHATPQLLQRQGSFRVFSQLNQSSPFKRQLSLRLSDLPSNLERTRSLSLDNAAATENSTNIINNNSTPQQPLETTLSPEAPPRTQRNRLQSLPIAVNMAPIPESSPLVEPKADAVSAMCQQVSAGLSLLSNFPDPFSKMNNDSPNLTSPSSLELNFSETYTCTQNTNTSTTVTQNNGISSLLEGGINWNAGSEESTSNVNVPKDSSTMSRGEEWLSQLNSQQTFSNEADFTPAPLASVKKTPPLSQLRSSSLGAAPSSTSPSFPREGIQDLFSAPTTTEAHFPPATKTSANPNDPFDAEWVALASRGANPNNPFLNNTVTKAFEVQM